jgi:hypothetical protein
MPCLLLHCSRWRAMPFSNGGTQILLGITSTLEKALRHRN